MPCSQHAATRKYLIIPEPTIFEATTLKSTDMKFFKYCIITVVILGLLDPTEGGWLKKTLKKIGGGVKKAVKSVGNAVKKVGCKVLFGVGCPAAVGALGTALSAGTSGLGTAVVATGVAVGTNACHVRKEKCKRSVEMTEVMLPFSDEFSDYDMNGDKLITYEEFVYAVLKSVNMADPEELREPFMFADFDDNGVLDTDEFHGAPFLFAHANRGQQAAVAA